MIDNLTIGEAKQLASMLSGLAPQSAPQHPMLGRRCLIRTYSAGVHIGDVDYINPQNSMEVRLKNALRLWKWEGGGLSLSAVANDGIKGGRLNATGEVYLTNAIEFIPTTEAAEKSYVKFIE
jgi:hypothetical protein